MDPLFIMGTVKEEDRALEIDSRWCCGTIEGKVEGDCILEMDPRWCCEGKFEEDGAPEMDPRWCCGTVKGKVEGDCVREMDPRWYCGGTIGGKVEGDCAPEKDPRWCCGGTIGGKVEGDCAPEKDVVVALLEGRSREIVRLKWIHADVVAVLGGPLKGGLNETVILRPQFHPLCRYLNSVSAAYIHRLLRGASCKSYLLYQRRQK